MWSSSPSLIPDETPKFSHLLPLTARKILEDPKKYESIKELSTIAKAMQEIAAIMVDDEYRKYLNANAGFEQNVIDTLNNLGTVLDESIVKGKMLDPGAAKDALQKIADSMKGSVIEGGGFWNAPDFTKEDGWEERIRVLSSSVSPMQQQIANEMRRIMASNGVSPGLSTPAPAPAAKPAKPETDKAIAA